MLIRSILRVLSHITPAERRDDWLREWQSEMHYALVGLHGPQGGESPSGQSRFTRLTMLFRCLGALEDALWLRLRKREPRMIGQHIKYAFRSLRKQPGFSAVVILTLALGIGANAAMYTVIDAALFRPLPFEDPDRVMHFWQTRLEDETRLSNTSYPNYLDWRAQSETFAQLAGYGGRSLTYTGDGAPERFEGVRVTASFFPVLGVRPVLGRGIVEADMGPDAPRLVVMAHGLWQRRFGGDSDIIGRVLTLNNMGYTVIGVLPPAFEFARRRNAELWIPLVLSQPEATTRGFRWFHVIGRLTPSATVQQARDEMNLIAQRLIDAYPGENRGRGIAVVPMPEQALGAARSVMLILFGAVGLILLITSANVANLLLARSAAREKEMSIRAALGAGRARLLAQMLTESAALALAGGATGVLLAKWGIDALPAMLPEAVRAQMPYLNALELNGGVLLFSLAVSLFTGVLFGLAPALQISTVRLQHALKDGARTSDGGHRQRLRQAFVTAEVSLALVLLLGTGLMVRSMTHLLNESPGFDPDNLLTLRISLPAADYQSEAKILSFNRQLVSRVGALPGVVGVSSIDRLPLSGNLASSGFGVVGDPQPRPGEGPQANRQVVSPAYFRVMNIPLIQGRLFEERDDANAPPVLVINETLADQVFADRNPLGRKLGLRWGGGMEFEIVGIVGDVKLHTFDGNVVPTFYVSSRQIGSRTTGLVVRTASDPVNLIAAIRREVQAIDPNVPIYAVQMVEDMIAASPSLFLRRYPTWMLAGFAALATILVTLGLYGVISYSVTQRTREIGVRMALGAEPRAVVRQVVGEGMKMVGLGLAIGVVASLGLARFLSSMLFGIQPSDPATFAVVIPLLTGIGLLACLLPAQRATRIDPTEALRSE